MPTITPYSIVSKGTVQSKTDTATVTIPNVTAVAGETLLVAFFAQTTASLVYNDGPTITWNGQTFDSLWWGGGSGNTYSMIVAKLSPEKVGAGATASVSIAYNPTNGKEATAYAAEAVGVKGLQFETIPTSDGALSNSGTGSSLTSTFSGVAGGTQYIDFPPSLVFSVGCIYGPSGDTAGTWTNMTGLSRVGTSGNAASSNCLIQTGYRVAQASTDNSNTLSGYTSRTATLLTVALPIKPISANAFINPAAGFGTMYVVDNFRRTGTTIGYADTGELWTQSHGVDTWLGIGTSDATFGFDGFVSAGFGSINTGGAEIWIPTTQSTVTDQYLSARFGISTGWPDYNPEATAQFLLRAQSTASWSNDLFYELRVKYSTSAITMRVMAGGAQIIAPVTVKTTGITQPNSPVMRLRFAATGTSPTTLRAKLWYDSELEPSTWQLSGTNSTAGYQTALGGPGLGAILEGSYPSGSYGDSVVDWIMLTSAVPDAPKGFVADAFLRDLLEEGSFTANAVIISDAGTRERTVTADAMIVVVRQGPYEVFRDTFTGTGNLNNHTSDSGHSYATNRTDIPTIYKLVGNRLFILVGSAYPIGRPIFNGELTLQLNVGLDMSIPAVHPFWNGCGFTLYEPDWGGTGFTSNYTEILLFRTPYSDTNQYEPRYGLETPWHNNTLWPYPYTVEANTVYSLKVVILSSWIQIYVNDVLQYEDDMETGLVHQHHPYFEDPHTPLNHQGFNGGPYNMAIHQQLGIEEEESYRWIDNVVYVEYLCIIAKAFIVPLHWTADAVIEKVQTGSRTANAVIKGTISSSRTADAVIAIPYYPITANAILLGTLAGSFTANAEMAANPTASFSADAYLTNPVLRSFTANSVIKAMSRMQHTRALHIGLDTITDHVLGQPLVGLPAGTSFHDVLVELDRRVTAIEARSVASPRHFRWFISTAVIRGTASGSFVAKAILAA